MSFASFNLRPEIMKQIEAEKYTQPTPIQEKAIPAVLQGLDVLGLAQTGTGKTAAFVLPMLQKLMTGPKGRLRGLIIAPTRELAEQINATVRVLGKNTGLFSHTVYGGVSMKTQVNAIRRGVDIVIACPGRLLDHLDQRTIDLSRIEILVLDEADQMFDMGFLPNIRQILTYMPVRRQNLLFSATMPNDVRRLTQSILKDPVTIEVGHTVPLEAITHAVYPVKAHLKTDLLLHIVQHTAAESMLIFTKTKHRAKSVDALLQKHGYRSASLHGNLSQNKRQQALDGFRDGKFDYMVATDIAARGIDVSKVSHVINFDLPDTTEAYTHRTGRTGRASRSGDAYTIVVPDIHDEVSMLRQIEKKLGNAIPQIHVDTFDYSKASSTVPKSAFARAPHMDPRRKKSGASSGNRKRR